MLRNFVSHRCRQELGGSPATLLALGQLLLPLPLLLLLLLLLLLPLLLPLLLLHQKCMITSEQQLTSTPCASLSRPAVLYPLRSRCCAATSRCCAAASRLSSMAR
jgi:hypothetical protein